MVDRDRLFEIVDTLDSVRAPVVVAEFDVVGASDAADCFDRASSWVAIGDNSAVFGITDDNSSMTVPDHPAASGDPKSNSHANVRLNDRWRLVSASALVCLILVCVAWETFVAPLRPGGSWLVLKAVPLLLPLRGILRGRLYTYQWASMLVLLYVMEGAVRATSDTAGASVIMAWLELMLAGVFFVAAVAYVRPAKRAAKQIKRKQATLDQS